MSIPQRIFFDFKETIHRIILLFYAWAQWTIALMNGEPFSQPILQEKEHILSSKDKYIESRKKAFFASFEKTGMNWNENIEPVFKDANELAEIMKDPQNELEKKWRSRVLIENTPRGNVIMFYDAYKRGFSYYCDHAVMPYDIMNAVAMKYVLTFFCRDFFVDSMVLPKKDVEDKDCEKDTKKEKKPNVVKIDKQAFAKFKTYNTATKKVEEKNKVINCFMHLGASRNWLPIMKTVKLNPINGFQTDLVPSNKKLSYLEYKKMKS
jgi:hypothetical protein